MNITFPIEIPENLHRDLKHIAKRSGRAVNDLIVKIIVDGLNNVPGIRCHKPSGAFYVFPNIKDTGRSSKEISNLLLTEAGVAVLSGTTFGAHGEGFMRMSYANSQDNIRLAIERIASVLRG